MPRPYRARKARLQLAETARRWLLFEEHAESDEDLRLCYLDEGRALWDEYRDALLAEWIDERAGTRPFAWWEYDAPPDFGTPATIERNMRRKVAGSGEESAAVYGDRSRAYYDCDPDAPPKIESQAAYLKRLGLLLPGEEARIKPAAFRPVVLDVDPEGWAPAGAGGWTPEAA